MQRQAAGATFLGNPPHLCGMGVELVHPTQPAPPVSLPVPALAYKIVALSRAPLAASTWLAWAAARSAPPRWLDSRDGSTAGSTLFRSAGRGWFLADHGGCEGQSFRLEIGPSRAQGTAGLQCLGQAALQGNWLRHST